jgi:hypothetical protein
MHLVHVLVHHVQHYAVPVDEIQQQYSTDVEACTAVWVAMMTLLHHVHITVHPAAHVLID